jgi:hypothetical protein
MLAGLHDSVLAYWRSTGSLPLVTFTLDLLITRASLGLFSCLALLLGLALGLGS